MKIEIPYEQTKTLWKELRYDWRFWAATTAVTTVLLITRCLVTGCRHKSHRHES